MIERCSHLLGEVVGLGGPLHPDDALDVEATGAVGVEHVAHDELHLGVGRGVQQLHPAPHRAVDVVQRVHLYRMIEIVKVIYRIFQ